MAKEQEPTSLADEEPKKMPDEEQSTEETKEEPPGPKNKVTVEDSGPCKKKVIIEIPEEKVKTAIDKQYEDLRKEAIVPGFRKGRAPRRLLEKRFGKEATEQIKLTLLADASKTAIEEQELQTIGEPDIEPENLEKIEVPEQGPMNFDFEVEVYPDFDLPKLEGIAVTKPKLEVDDKQIDNSIEEIQKNFGLWTPREKSAVELDDQVIADVIMEIEGVEEHKKLDNIEIYTTHNSYVDNVPVEKLDEILIGAKSGDEKETSIEVPKTYYNQEYRGKKINIKISIKEIKFLKPAELDENFFQNLGMENEQQLRDTIRTRLQSQLDGQIKAEMADQIYDYLNDNTSFELPLSIVAEQAENVLKRQYVNLIMKGFSREQVSAKIEELKSNSEEQAKQQVKTFFIMDKIAEKFDISISEEEINGHLAQVAVQQGQRPEKMKEQMNRDGSLTQFTMELRQNKCIEKLLETAKITEEKTKKVTKKTKATDKDKKSAGKSASKSDKPKEKKSAKDKKQKQKKETQK